MTIRQDPRGDETQNSGESGHINPVKTQTGRLNDATSGQLIFFAKSLFHDKRQHG